MDTAGKPLIGIGLSHYGRTCDVWETSTSALVVATALSLAVTLMPGPWSATMWVTPTPIPLLLAETSLLLVTEQLSRQCAHGRTLSLRRGYCPVSTMWIPQQALRLASRWSTLCKWPSFSPWRLQRNHYSQVKDTNGFNVIVRRRFSHEPRC